MEYFAAAAAAVAAAMTVVDIVVDSLSCFDSTSFNIPVVIAAAAAATSRCFVARSFVVRSDQINPNYMKPKRNGAMERKEKPKRTWAK